MKAKIIAGVLAALSMSACADLGFGVDVGDSYYDPYYYNGIYGPAWGNGAWDWDYPLYNPGPAVPPPRPPLIGNNPGPVIRPNVRPNVNPGINGVPTVTPGGMSRPGNGGLPSVQQPSALPAGNAESNNARRGR